MSKLYNLPDALTLTTATNHSDLVTGRAGIVNIAETFVQVTTLVSSTGAPTINLLKGSTTLGTATLAINQADNTQVFFTPSATYTNNPNVEFASGDTLSFDVGDASSSAGVVNCVLAFEQAGS